MIQKQKRVISYRTSENYELFIDEFKKLLDSVYNKVYIENIPKQFIYTNDVVDTNRKVKGFFTELDSFIVYDISLTSFFHPIDNGVCIHMLTIDKYSQKQGYGSQFLSLIKIISDEFNIPIFLIPVSISTTPLFVLQNFYHKFGYKREGNSLYWKYSPNSDYITLRNVG